MPSPTPQSRPLSWKASSLRALTLLSFPRSMLTRWLPPSRKSLTLASPASPAPLMSPATWVRFGSVLRTLTAAQPKHSTLRISLAARATLLSCVDLSAHLQSRAVSRVTRKFSISTPTSRSFLTRLRTGSATRPWLLLRTG